MTTLDERLAEEIRLWDNRGEEVEECYLAGQITLDQRNEAHENICRMETLLRDLAAERERLVELRRVLTQRWLRCVLDMPDIDLAFAVLREEDPELCAAALAALREHDDA